MARGLSLSSTAALALIAGGIVAVMAGGDEGSAPSPPSDAELAALVGAPTYRVEAVFGGVLRVETARGEARLRWRDGAWRVDQPLPPAEGAPSLTAVPQAMIDAAAGDGG